jgi:hypothetical protein
VTLEDAAIVVAYLEGRSAVRGHTQVVASLRGIVERG